MKSKKQLPSVRSKESNPTKQWKWLILLLAFISYIETISYDFTLDDPLVITGNTFVQEGWSAIPKIFTTVNLEGFNGEKESNYRPVSICQFAVEKSLFGLNPQGFHLVHILYYGLVCMLAFIFLLRIFKELNPLIPFVIAILYTVHPIHVEVVASLKSRDELMGMIGILSCLILILRPTHSMVSRLGIFLVSCLAFFAKESTIPLLLVAPMTIYFFTQRTLKQIFIDSIPVWSAALLYLMMRQLIAHTPAPAFLLEENALLFFDRPERWFAALALIGHYIQLMLFPLTLRADYSFDQLHLRGWTDPWAYAGFLIFLLSLYVAYRGFKSKSPWSYAMIFTGLFYSVTANILIMTGATMAERFMFVPSLGLMILFVLSILQITQNFKLSHNGLMGICGIVGLLWLVKTFDRNPDWKNNDTIYAATYSDSPESIRALTKMARILYSQAIDPKNEANKTVLLDESLRLLDKSLNIYNGYGLSNLLKGLSLRLKNDMNGSLQYFEKAANSPTQAPTAYLQLGITHKMLNLDSLALIDLKVAENKGLKSALLYHELATLYYESNLPLQAVGYYKKLNEVNPSDIDALNQIVRIYRDQLNDIKNAQFYNEKLRVLIERGK